MKKLNRKHKGFSELIIIVALILLAIILVVAFKSKLQPKTNEAIEQIETEIDGIGGWTTTP